MAVTMQAVLATLICLCLHINIMLWSESYQNLSFKALRSFSHTLCQSPVVAPITNDPASKDLHEWIKYYHEQ